MDALTFLQSKGIIAPEAIDLYIQVPTIKEGISLVKLLVEFHSQNYINTQHRKFPDEDEISTKKKG